MMFTQSAGLPGVSLSLTCPLCGKTRDAREIRERGPRRGEHVDVQNDCGFHWSAQVSPAGIQRANLRDNLLLSLAAQLREILSTEDQEPASAEKQRELVELPRRKSAQL